MIEHNNWQITTKFILDRYTVRAFKMIGSAAVSVEIEDFVTEEAALIEMEAFLKEQFDE